MAYHENNITMVGNLTDDPDLRFTPGGTAVCNLRVASNRRWTGRDGQQQEETTFMNVNVWREAAEHVADSLHKGDRVVVIGRIRVRNYDNQQGQTVWVTEIEADEIAPSLRWATATVTKASRGSSSASDSSSGTSDSGATSTPTDDDVPF